MQVRSKSIHSFMIRCRQAFFNNLSPYMTLKMGPWSPKSNQFFSMSLQYRCRSLVKILTFILDIGFQKSESRVTLRTGSRSPKYNQFLPQSQQYSCIKLVKIHPFILEIGCRQAIFQQSKPLCDLENGINVTKNLLNSVLCHVTAI